MIALLLALAAATQTVEAAEEARPSDQALFASCADTVRTDPEKAVSLASEWRIRGGGLFARQCLGLAYVALERWAPAATTFEQAATEAETAQDPRRADFWVQSGNAWLATGEGEKARLAFDAALATTLLTPELRGEVHLDRARADVLLDDLAGARADLDKGLALVPADPFAWYLSAALALRQGEMARANADIAKAVALAPDDAEILLQAGTIAGTAGDIAAAKSFYARAAEAEPESRAGKAALAALGMADSPQPEPAE